MFLKKGFIKIIILIALCLVINETTEAAGPPGFPGQGGGGSGPPCWPTPCVPIDGGIVLLLAAGLAYGAKKAYDNYKKEEAIKSE